MSGATRSKEKGDLFINTQNDICTAKYLCQYIVVGNCNHIERNIVY